MLPFHFLQKVYVMYTVPKNIRKALLWILLVFHNFYNNTIANSEGINPFAMVTSQIS